MTDIKEVEALRLKLLENGFTPIRNWDKKTYMKGWPSAEITADEIRRWSRRFSRDTATGIRVENGLAVIDIDIDDKETVDAVANAMLDAALALSYDDSPLLVRTGKGAKEAWYVRTNELFSRIHSHAWCRPGENEDDGTHRIEIFGGAVARQFGSFGPHTREDDGSVSVSYSWPERSPLDTRQSELPLLTKAQFFAMVDAAEQTLRERGWVQVKRSEKGESDAHRVYDLTEEMQFDLDSGERVSLLELRELAGQRDGMRCSASWLEGPQAVNTTRCIIGQTSSGHLTIWESAAGTTHMEASLKPREFVIDEAAIAKLNALRQRKSPSRVNKIKPGVDDARQTASKMLELYAYRPEPVPLIVELDARSPDVGMSKIAARDLFASNVSYEPGRTEGAQPIKINPVDVWMADPRRVTVGGLRMRPDQPLGLYEEDGKKWINIYDPPAHDATGGSPDVGVRFLEHLLPDAGERHWFTQWLAYKLLNPHVPGPAVVMVARNFGTGRGTLGELVRKLLGRAYTATMPFSIISGKDYQAQYTEWMATCLMAFVSESSEAEISIHRQKSNAYEHLKEMVEPRQHERMFVAKGTKSFKGMCSTSFLIATNNVDALPIPAHDRRFAVLSNGDANDPEFWIEINRWMADDANVAAFFGWLASYDLTGYSPYEAPPKTEAQALMAELSRSSVDRAIDEALDRMVGEVFTVEQVVALVDRVRSDDDSIDLPDSMNWKSIVRREVVKRCYRVGVFKGTNWQPLIEGKRCAVYARTGVVAARWKTHERLHQEVLKNRPTTLGEAMGKVVALDRSRKR